jgi:hypothetical protein
MDWSGRERDKLFLSENGSRFFDASYLGGVDSPLDGRAFAYSDLDHDGATDFILVNRNAPIIQIFRNTMTQGDWVGLRLTGDGRHSNVDAVGARVTARCGTDSVTRYVGIGSGFGVQNTSTLTIGLGVCPSIDELSVRWPDGREQTFDHLKSGEYYRVSEGASIEPTAGFYSPLKH